MSIKKETLAKYVSDNFVETGTCEGDGVAIALECGFKDIYSVEIDPVLFGMCKKRFDGMGNVHLYNGDSLVVLPQILDSLRTPCTFWLDAHLNDVSIYAGKFRCPILQEIDTIMEHSLYHTLLIDDRRLFQGNGISHWDYVQESEILDTIYTRNKTAIISYEDGYVPNDIIVVRNG